MSNERLGDAITSIVEGVSDEAKAQDETLEVAVEVTEEEVAREVEDKCYKAFQAFDTEGNGGEVKVDQVR